MRSFWLIAALAGCSFHVSAIDVATSTSDGATRTDAAMSDGPSTARDLTPPSIDLANFCASGGSSTCSTDGSSLVTCFGGQSMTTACDNGCSSANGAHCAMLDPGGPATPADYEQSGLSDIAVTGSDTITFNTDTGGVTDSNFTRTSNGLQGGIYFRQVAQTNGPTLGIFAMKSLSTDSGTKIKTTGAAALSIVTLDGITIGGSFDMQGGCGPTSRGGLNVGTPGPGGGNGGGSAANNGLPGQWAGGGGGGVQGNMIAAGGGGGGYGEIGGNGATITTTGMAMGGAAGMIFNPLSVADPMIVGGGGGGSGGGDAAQTGQGGLGGGGGGALQLASNGMITLGASASIQAGGCGGALSSGDPGGGGGGGAGGMVLIEAPTITLTSGATITVNGGAGGGGGSGGSAGAAGPNDTSSANGGSGGTNASNGGNGGHSGSLTGDAAPKPGKHDVSGGGGGGGVGRIALKSKDGNISTSGVTLSPKIGEMNGTDAAPAITGMATFD